MKLKKGDSVKIIKGKDKGKTGTIDRVYGAENKVLIPDINVAKRHVKGQAGKQKSEIVLIAKPLPIANVQLICPKCKIPTRVGYSIEKKEKVRVCRKCGQAI